MPDYEVTSTVEGDTVVVAMAGAFDLHNREELKAALLAAVDAAPRIRVDLGAVTFFDSSGLHALVAAYLAAEERDRALYVTNATGNVATVLEITGIMELVRPPHDSEPTGVRHPGHDG